MNEEYLKEAERILGARECHKRGHSNFEVVQANISSDMNVPPKLRRLKCIRCLTVWELTEVTE